MTILSRAQLTVGNNNDQEGQGTRPQQVHKNWGKKTTLDGYLQQHQLRTQNEKLGENVFNRGGLKKLLLIFPSWET